MKALTHTQAREWLQREADGLLEAAQLSRLQEHLQGCAECRAYQQELGLLENMLREGLLAHWGRPQLPPGAEKALLEKQIGRTPPRPPNVGRWLLLFGALGAAALLAWQALGSQPQAQATATEQPSSSTSAPGAPATNPAPAGTATPLASQTFTPGATTLVAVPVQTVNCREGNSSQYDIADTLFADTEYSPLGRGRDNLWVQFRGPVNPVRCWVYVENLTLLLNGQPTEIEDVPESLLPYLAYPPTATPSPTSPRPPQCSDGIDNDGDGYIDLQDTSCTDAKDDNEGN